MATMVPTEIVATERCCSCGLAAAELRKVRIAVIGSEPVFVLVCRDCFGRHHWAELAVDERASPREVSRPGTGGDLATGAGRP